MHILTFASASPRLAQSLPHGDRSAGDVGDEILQCPDTKHIALEGGNGLDSGPASGHGCIIGDFVR